MAIILETLTGNFETQEAANGPFFNAPNQGELTVLTPPFETAQQILNRIAPLEDCEERRIYNKAMSAYVGRYATEEQVGLVTYVDTLIDIVSRPHDRPTAPPNNRFL
jgi:hypothetical protein